MKNSPQQSLGHLAGSTEQKAAYHRTVQFYEVLIQELRANLDNSQQASLNTHPSNIIRRQGLMGMDDHLFSHPGTVNAPHGSSVIESPTYVGKVSGIHFIRTVLQCTQRRDLFDDEDSAGQTYGETRISESLAALSHPLFGSVPRRSNTFPGYLPINNSYCLSIFMQVDPTGKVSASLD